MNLIKPLVLEVKYKDRLDKYIANNSDISRNDVQQIITTYGVLVDHIEVRKANFQVFENQKIIINFLLKKEMCVVPQDIKIDIIYEDNDIAIINKKSGMVVHPSPGHYDQTLVNALLFYFKDKLSNLNGQIRPGIVHRIDKDTSGLLLIAKNNKAHNYFASLLQEHKICREYIALVDGIVSNNIIHLSAPIGRDPKNKQKFCVTSTNSKHAISHIFVLKRFKDKTLVRIKLETGRTHQIRVHLAYLKHPVFGDEIYNKKIDKFNQRLHAYKIAFQDLKKKNLEFWAMPSLSFFANSGIKISLAQLKKLLS